MGCGCGLGAVLSAADQDAAKQLLVKWAQGPGKVYVDVTNPGFPQPADLTAGWSNNVASVAMLFDDWVRGTEPNFSPDGSPTDLLLGNLKSWAAGQAGAQGKQGTDPASLKKAMAAQSGGNTTLYIVGGLAVVGLLGAFFLMNKKR